MLPSWRRRQCVRQCLAVEAASPHPSPWLLLEMGVETAQTHPSLCLAWPAAAVMAPSHLSPWLVVAEQWLRISGGAMRGTPPVLRARVSDAGVQVMSSICRRSRREVATAKTAVGLVAVRVEEATVLVSRVVASRVATAAATGVAVGTPV